MQELEHAARALGWDGHLVANLEVFGARFAAVARIRPDVHRWRHAHGWGPELDPSSFRSSSESDRIPVAAVDLIGILVSTARVEDALSACGTLLTLAPCAVVVPWTHPYVAWQMMELDYYGVGVLHATGNGPAQLALEPQDRTVEFGTSLFGRWMLEVLYSKLLEQQPQLAENA